jgi:hypothetical protein
MTPEEIEDDCKASPAPENGQPKEDERHTGDDGIPPMKSGFPFLAMFGQTASRSATNPRPESAHHQAAEGREADVPVEPLKATTEYKLARYSLWMAVFTGVLVLFTGGTLYVVWRQGKQIEREFISTHRPRLVLRRVTFEQNPFQPPDVKIEIANAGESEATITRLAVVFIVAPAGTPPAWRILQDLEKGLIAEAENHTLSSGDSYALRIPPGDVFSLFSMNTGQTRLYCIGFVEYRDAYNFSVRRTGFIRYSTTGNAMGQFERRDDPDFEYAD